MIKPAKHMNLDLSLIRISALLLKRLYKKRIISIDDALSRLQQKVGEDASIVFMPALTFLYILGKVEYHQHNDSLEYLE